MKTKNNMKFSDVFLAEGFLQCVAGIHPAPDAAMNSYIKALPERPEPILFFAKIGFLCVQRHKGALVCARLCTCKMLLFSFKRYIIIM